MDTISEFVTVLENLENLSGNDKEEYLANEFEKSGEGWKAAAQFFSSNDLDDLGVAKKSVAKALAWSEGGLDDVDNVMEHVNNHDNVSDMLRSTLHFGGGSNNSMEELRTDCIKLKDLSGHDAINHVADMFDTYTEPYVVSFSILNDLNTGVTEKTVINAVCEGDTVRKRALCTDIVTLLERERSGNPILEPRIHAPFKPMKAMKKDLPDDLSNWVGQIKLDGNRLLIHVSNHGEEVTAYSRRLNDVTFSLPELERIPWPDGEYIFDCEVMAADNTYKSTSERVGAKEFDEDPAMVFHMFDVVYANEDLSYEPFMSRYTELETVLGPVEEMSEYVNIVETFEDISDAKNHAEKKDFEGIIAKDKDGEYDFDKRSSNWIKDKNTLETGDFIITDVLEGDGKQSNTLGSLSLETRDGVDVGNVGSGFTDEQLDEFWERRDELVGNVIEVKFEGIDDNLRFPVFIRERPQGEADTLERIQNIAEMQ